MQDSPAGVAALQHPHPGAHVLQPARGYERHAAPARHQDAGIVWVQRLGHCSEGPATTGGRVTHACGSSAGQACSHRSSMDHAGTGHLLCGRRSCCRGTGVLASLPAACLCHLHCSAAQLGPGVSKPPPARFPISPLCTEKMHGM